MSDMKASVIVDLAGNLQQRARQYAGSINGFSRSGQRALGMLRVSANGVGKALDAVGHRYVALATGGAVVAGGKQVADFSARLTQLGIDAGFGGEQLAKFKKETDTAIRDAAIKWGVGSDAIAGGLEDVVQKTGDIKFAAENMENLALAVKATGAQGSDIGRILAEFQKMGATDPTNVLKLLDTMVVQGKAGAFTLRDLATEGERIFAAYTPKSIDQVREMGAVLQTMRGSSASAAETVTSFQAFLRALNDKETAKKITGKGIKIFDPEQLKKGMHELLPLPVILNNIAKYTKGDRLKLGSLFGDADSTKALTRLFDEFKTTGKMATLDGYLAVSGTGTQTTKDAIENLHEFNTQLVRLQEAGERFANTNLAKPLKDVADTLGSMDASAMTEIMEKTKDWAILVGSVLVAYKGIKAALAITGAARAAGGALASGPAMAGATGLGAMGGPVPVYIVDGPALGDAPDGSGKRGGKRSKWGRAGKALGKVFALGGVATASWEAGSAIHENFLAGTAFSDALGRAIARGLAAAGNEDALETLRLQSKVEILLKTDGNTKATITNKSDNVDAQLQAGKTMVTR